MFFLNDGGLKWVDGMVCSWSVIVIFWGDFDNFLRVVWFGFCVIVGGGCLGDCDGWNLLGFIW